MKKKLMIDMDDVITEGGFLYLVNTFLNTNYKKEDFDGYYMQDIIEDVEKYMEFVSHENVYEHSTLIKDCVEVIKELNEVYDVFIVTSYIWKDNKEISGRVLEQKYNYLMKNLPFISPYKYIFTSDKSILDFDIKIDDRIKNLSNCETKLLFSAYHNTKISEEELDKENIKRVNNWKEVKELLL